jgi:peroxiredoxin
MSGVYTSERQPPLARSLFDFDGSGVILHEPDMPPGPDVGDPAPPFSAPVLTGGPRAISLRDLAGKTVFLELGGLTWCHPCQESAPIIEKLWLEFKPQGVQFIYVLFEDRRALTPQQMIDVVEQFGLTMPVVTDPEVIATYQTTSWPTTYIINAKGIICDKHIGNLDPDPAVHEQLLRHRIGACLGPYTPVYAQGDPGIGIGGYDLQSPKDRVFAFDYGGTGKVDHLALYRPGTGTFWILKNDAGTFSPVYAQGDPGLGIGGYDLQSDADRAFAFDHDSSGRLDHIVLYRPGTGTIWILKRTGSTFTPVYAQGDPGGGIGGYDLLSPNDRAFAFDYDGSGKLDHLVLYRPGTGTIWILKHAAGTFAPVYAQGDPGAGIGGYDLQSEKDRALAFDYAGSGRLDHLVLYRPGTGAIWILKNSAGTFAPVYAQGDPGLGIGGYNLLSAADRIVALDLQGTGRMDHLGLYRPGAGAFFILRNNDGVFSQVYAQGDPGFGIGGYNLLSTNDRAFVIDYDGSGNADHLALYRPGTGTIWILKDP